MVKIKLDLGRLAAESQKLVSESLRPAPGVNDELIQLIRGNNDFITSLQQTLSSSEPDANSLNVIESNIQESTSLYDFTKEKLGEANIQVETNENETNENEIE